MPTKTTYNPRPIDTSAVELPANITSLTEQLASNTHDVWARARIEQGWSFGPNRDDAAKKHPCLVAYEDLPETEKEYDRRTAIETLKLILALGYQIVPAAPTPAAPVAAQRKTPATRGRKPRN